MTSGGDTAVPPPQASPEPLDAMRALAAELIGRPVDQIDVTKPLGALGFDSIQTVELQGRTENRFGAVGLVFTPADDLATLATQVQQSLDGAAGRGGLPESVRTAWSRLRGTPS